MDRRRPSPASLPCAALGAASRTLPSCGPPACARNSASLPLLPLLVIRHNQRPLSADRRRVRYPALPSARLRQCDTSPSNKPGTTQRIDVLRSIRSRHDEHAEVHQGDQDMMTDSRYHLQRRQHSYPASNAALAKYSSMGVGHQHQTWLSSGVGIRRKCGAPRRHAQSRAVLARWPRDKPASSLSQTMELSDFNPPSCPTGGAYEAYFPGCGSACEEFLSTRQRESLSGAPGY